VLLAKTTYFTVTVPKLERDATETLKFPGVALPSKASVSFAIETVCPKIPPRETDRKNNPKTNKDRLKSIVFVMIRKIECNFIFIVFFSFPFSWLMRGSNSQSKNKGLNITKKSM
jgi:hypothetical protein